MTDKSRSRKRSWEEEEEEGSEQADNWSCLDCGTFNIGREKCLNCEQDSPDEPESTVISKRSQNDSWRCGFCKVNVLYGKVDCFKCKRIRAQAEAGPRSLDTKLSVHSRLGPKTQPDKDVTATSSGRYNTSWKCLDCNYRNLPERTKCFKCDPPNTKLHVLPASAPTRGGEWLCTVCAANNTASRLDCFKCQVPRPGEGQLEMLDDRYWQCKLCSFDNLQSSVKCFRCKAMKQFLCGQVDGDETKDSWRCPNCQIMNPTIKSTCTRCQESCPENERFKITISNDKSAKHPKPDLRNHNGAKSRSKPLSQESYIGGRHLPKLPVRSRDASPLPHQVTTSTFSQNYQSYLTRQTDHMTHQSEHALSLNEESDWTCRYCQEVMGPEWGDCNVCVRPREECDVRLPDAHTGPRSRPPHQADRQSDHGRSGRSLEQTHVADEYFERPYVHSPVPMRTHRHGEDPSRLNHSVERKRSLSRNSVRGSMCPSRGSAGPARSRFSSEEGITSLGYSMDGAETSVDGAEEGYACHCGNFNRSTETACLKCGLKKEYLSLISAKSQPDPRSSTTPVRGSYFSDI